MLRSHVDPCLFVRTLYAGPGTIAKDTVDSFASAPARDANRLFEAWRIHEKADLRRSFHETYHYWQGLRLPFLYLYGVHVNRGMMMLFREIARSGLDWSQLDSVVPEFFLLEIPIRCTVHSNKAISVCTDNGTVPPGAADSVALTPLDLLEGAASFFEWQAFTESWDDAINPKLFERWCKRHSSYTTAYTFLVRQVGAGAAVRCFPHIVEASFATNYPVRAFACLVATLAGYLRENAELHRRCQTGSVGEVKWKGLFGMFLNDHIPFEAEVDARFPFSPGDPFFRLSQDWFHGTLAPSGYAHFMLTPAARKWANKAQADDRFDDAFSGFRFASQEVWAELTNSFQPSLTLARFDFADGTSRLLAIHGGLENMDLQGLELPDLLTMFSICKATTGAFMHPDQRLCWHSQCPHYRRNRCNTFPAIPADHVNCTFPHRADELIKIIGRI